MCIRCDNIKSIVEEWINKQGHEKCWFYPELFGRIAAVLELSIDLTNDTIPRLEFERGCERFTKELYER